MCAPQISLRNEHGLFGGSKLIRLSAARFWAISLLIITRNRGYKWVGPTWWFQHPSIKMATSCIRIKRKQKDKKRKKENFLVRWRRGACFIESNHVDGQTLRYLLSLFLTNTTHSTVSQRAWWWSRQLSSLQARGKISGSTVQLDLLCVAKSQRVPYQHTGLIYQVL